MTRNCKAIALTLALSFSLLAKETPAMLYLPPKPYSMWDTWLFQDGDEYHLFFLQSEPGFTWNTLGRAVSKDLIHWKTLPPIPTKGPPGAWDHNPTLTGMTVKDGKRYALFYGSSTHGQEIGVMFSNDLKSWEKYPGNPVLVSKGPYYGHGDWRDLCTFYDPEEKVWHGYICAETSSSGEGGSPAIATISDKTLVAWVYLDNTTQRGGSVLTLDYGREQGDVFDAIVFGERKSGAWMAGSDFFRRTQSDQSAYQLETADPNELVQIAIAYAGKQITIYRNGEKYAEYTANGKVTFGDGTAVVMGLRHLGCARVGKEFFAGSIEEARIYDLPLDQETIRSLKPNELSTPKPVGLWTFEDGTAKDSMGNFPPGQLYGGARITDGRLHLNGKDSYLATSSEPLRKVSCIAHVISENLIEWKYLPPVFASSDFVNMEVPDYFELNGRHYLLFSSGGSWKNTSGRRNASGTYYVMSDRRDGPYHLPKRPLLLGSGQHLRTNYVGRTIPFPAYPTRDADKGNTRLLYHHTCGGQVTFAAVKLVRQNPDGTLWLQYWPGLDKLERCTLFDDMRELSLNDTVGPGNWSLRGNSLTGQAQGEPSVIWLPITAADMMITIELDKDAAEKVGAIFRWDGKRGVGVIVSRAADMVEVVHADYSQRSITTTLIDDIRGVKMVTGFQHLRVLARAHLAEVYLNDHWLFSIPLEGLPKSGRIGLYVEGGSARFRGVRIAEIEPLRNATMSGQRF